MNTVPLRETARVISEAAAEVSAVQVVSPSVVCKTTANQTTYFDVRTDEIVHLGPASVCKTTESNTQTLGNQSACKTAEVTNTTESVGKTTDIVDLYFNNEDKPSTKIKLMRMAKDETVFLRDGRRRNQLMISSKSDEAIKKGSRKEVVDFASMPQAEKNAHTHSTALHQALLYVWVQECQL